MILGDRQIKGFWKRIGSHSDPDTCWLWVGHIHKTGYGTYVTSNGFMYAHHISYFIHTGIDPKTFPKKVLRHTCGNRSCVNPAHIVMTKAPNNIGEFFMNTDNYRSPTRGKRITRTLTPEQAWDCRRLHDLGLSSKTLSEWFQVDGAVVESILTIDPNKRVNARAFHIDIVHEIRRNTTDTLTEIAKTYKVSYPTIRDIMLWRNYRYLPTQGNP